MIEQEQQTVAPTPSQAASTADVVQDDSDSLHDEHGQQYKYKGLRIGKLEARTRSDMGMRYDGMHWRKN